MAGALAVTAHTTYPRSNLNNLTLDTHYWLPAIDSNARRASVAATSIR